jgi:hypothetical protein
MIMKLRPRNILLTFALLLVACCSTLLMAQNRTSWSALKPEKSPSAVQVLIAGKRLPYYPLQQADDISLTIQGPTTLRLLTRIDFGNATGGEKSYYIRYEREGGEKKALRRVAANSDKVVLADNKSNYLSNSSYTVIDVPSGKQNYRFFVKDNASYKLYYRFFAPRTYSENDSSTVVFTPVKYTTTVPLLVKQKEHTYYRVGKQDSLKISVIGPARITVMTRLELEMPLLTAQKFRVQVFEDNQDKHTYSLKSWTSSNTEYKDKSTKVVGKAAKLYLDVPRGKHEYTFKLPDNNRSVLFRFYIPKKALGNNP